MGNPKIGIRPIIDGRVAERSNLEELTMNMAKNAAAFISAFVRCPDGQPVECVIADTTISGSAQARDCAEKFAKEHVAGTLSVTSCWCYGSETMDLDPMTVKAVWGFNGTENPGAVYLAAVMAVHAQKGVPAFSIYGHDVQDKGDTAIPADVQEKLIRFARCAVAVGTMRGKSYVNIGAVSMGIMGSYCDDSFFHEYLGIRPEFVDMTEVLRRMDAKIYDEEEYEKAYRWTKANCKEGFDNNKTELQHYVYDSKRLSYSFGGSATAGAIVKWFRDNFAELEKQQEANGGANAYETLNQMAERVPAGAEGLVVLPYFMGERSPVWDTNARGTIVGLSLSHTKAHLYRAFLEAVAYSLRHAMECTGEALGDYILLAGGVTKSKLWRQIFADVTGYPVVCPLNDVEANLGDVMLAGIGTGLLTWEQIKTWQVLDEKVMPDPEQHGIYNQYYQLYRSVYAHLKTDMAALSQII